jgi:malate dehydrogenase
MKKADPPRKNFKHRHASPWTTTVLSQIAKTGKAVADIEKLTVLNPLTNDVHVIHRFATINGASVKDMINDQEWNANTFLPTVGSAALPSSLHAVSAASAANVAIDRLRDWALGTNGKWVTKGIPSDGQYVTSRYDVWFCQTCEGGEYTSSRDFTN